MDVRRHPVINSRAHAAAVSEYRRDGYEIIDESLGVTNLRYRSHGSLLAHLALFFTVGWLTFGLLNAWYAIGKRRQTTDRVMVVTQ